MIARSPDDNPLATHADGTAGPSSSGRRIRVEDIAQHAEFVPLAQVPHVVVDLRYAGTNNFAGRSLYGTLNCAWLRREAALGLAQAAQALHALRPGWRLLVLDALRPHRVQQAAWQQVVGTPAQAYFADPSVGSIHSFGMAVDVTLLDAQGRELGAAEMGSGFDEMSPLSHPELHDEHLAAGLLSAAQVEARNCLQAAMAQGGFAGISTEWWHFDHSARERVRREFPRVD